MRHLTGTRIGQLIAKTLPRQLLKALSLRTWANLKQ